MKKCQTQNLPIGTGINILLFIVMKSIRLEGYVAIVWTSLGANKKGNTHIIQYAVCQREIIGSVCCGSLNWDHMVVNIFHLIQIGNSITDISWCYSHIQNNSMVRVQRLMGEIVRSHRLSRAVHMTGFRVGSAHSLVAAASALFQILFPLFSLPKLFPASTFQFFSPFLLICLQALPISSRAIR